MAPIIKPGEWRSPARRAEHEGPAGPPGRRPARLHPAERRGSSPLTIIAVTASIAGLAVVLGTVHVLSGDAHVLDRIKALVGSGSQRPPAETAPGPPPDGTAASSAAPAPPDDDHREVVASLTPTQDASGRLDDLLLLSTVDSLQQSIGRIRETRAEVEAARVDIASFETIGGLDDAIAAARRSIASSRATSDALVAGAQEAAARLLDAAGRSPERSLALLRTALDELGPTEHPERERLLRTFIGAIEDLPHGDQDLAARAARALRPHLPR